MILKPVVEISVPVAEGIDPEFLGQPVFDWWPRDQVKSRQDSLSERRLGAIYWKTTKGLLTTARLLGEAESEEDLARIWISARLRSSDDRMLAGSAREEVRAALGEGHLPHNLWHAAVRGVLPIESDDLRCLKLPQTIEEFVDLSVVVSAASLGASTLVRVSRARTE